MIERFRRNKESNTLDKTVASNAAGISPKNDSIAVDKATIEILIKTCERMLMGDLEARAINIPQDHPLKALANAINGSFDLVDAYTRESATAIEFCSNDLFFRPLLPQGLPGVFGRSANIINQGGIRMRDSHQEFEKIVDLSEDNASSINTIAAACEELSATNQEITRHAQSSAGNAHDTAQQAHDLNQSVGKMSAVLKEIDSTVNMIESIAEQTHLLALNAMIEASRAGGKGTRFEVVANEVKDLAKNTSKATDEIKRQVLQINEIARKTGLSFEAIEKSIDSIEASSNLIENSLTNQVYATQEVTQSINGVANNMETVTENIRNLKCK